MTRPAIHPGEILSDELEEVGINASELCRQINVPVSRIMQSWKWKGREHCPALREASVFTVRRTPRRIRARRPTPHFVPHGK